MAVIKPMDKCIMNSIKLLLNNVPLLTVCDVVGYILSRVVVPGTTLSFLEDPGVAGIPSRAVCPYLVHLPDVYVILPSVSSVPIIHVYGMQSCSKVITFNDS